MGHLHVLRKGSLVSECIAAHLTRKGLHPGVDYHVIGKFAPRDKLLPAHLAFNELPCMDAKVFSQRFHALVRFAALRAPVWFVSGTVCGRAGHQANLMLAGANLGTSCVNNEHTLSKTNRRVRKEEPDFR